MPLDLSGDSGIFFYEVSRQRNAIWTVEFAKLADLLD